MSRHIFAYEGVYPINGNGILPGALTWKGDIPIVFSNPRNLRDAGDPIGHVEDIQREDDGSITGEFVLADEILQVPVTWGWTIYATAVKWAPERRMGIRWVDSAIVRLVYPANELPWMSKISESQGKPTL